MQFSIDTSALLDAWIRWYPPDVFPSFWERMEGLVEHEVVTATEEVLHELERKDDDVFDWAKGRPKLFLPFDEPIQIAAADVLSQFPRLVDQRPGKHLADPFVIGVARVHGLAVVTGEQGGTANKPKIPFVCDHYGIRCINVVEMIRELGWSF
jgi:hypothetical protein